MTIFMHIVVFFLGACFVSCGNCISYRASRGLDWVHDRSVCEGCGKPLRFWELIPVLSCLVLRGTCPRCGHRFGCEHAETEAAGGVCALLVCAEIQDLWVQMVRVLIFGVFYCILSWMVGHSAREK